MKQPTGARVSTLLPWANQVRLLEERLGQRRIIVLCHPSRQVEIQDALRTVQAKLPSPLNVEVQSSPYMEPTHLYAIDANNQDEMIRWGLQ